MGKKYFKIDNPNSIDKAIIEVLEKYRTGDREFYLYLTRRQINGGFISMEQEIDLLLDNLIENQQLITAKFICENISFFSVITIAYVLPNGNLRLLQDELCCTNVEG